MAASHDPDEYLLPSERRVIRVRRHWSVVAWDVFEAAALLAVVIMLSKLLPANAWLFMTILWYAGLLVLLRFAYTLYEWWDELLVVTDKRFVLATGVFTTRIAMMPLTKVTDLTYERSAAGRLFGYGTIVVESAGQIQAFNRIDHLPEPERIYDAISELVFGDKQAQSERFSMIRAQRIARGKKPIPR
ncbi:MAG TPA: PH domain-containing protein [Pseudonocardiaceae bacterium]|nr:PH domain-containing protein [Pseudonocardiaceae bacterium]